MAIIFIDAVSKSYLIMNQYVMIYHIRDTHNWSILFSWFLSPFSMIVPDISEEVLNQSLNPEDRVRMFL
jgi:hypothetical protein